MRAGSREAIDETVITLRTDAPPTGRRRWRHRIARSRCTIASDATYTITVHGRTPANEVSPPAAGEESASREEPREPRPEEQRRGELHAVALQQAGEP